MAVLSMKRIEICALQKDTKPLLSLLQQRGIVEISKQKAIKNTFKEDTSQKEAEYAKTISQITLALEALAPLREDKQGLIASLAGREKIEKETLLAVLENMDKTAEKANEVLKAQRDIAEKKALLVKLDGNIAALSPYLELDLPLVCTDTKKSTYFVGAVGGEQTLDSLYEALAKETQANFHLEILKTTKSQSFIFLLCNKENKKELEAALRIIGFEYPAVANKGIPFEETENCKEEILKVKEQIEEHKEALKAFAKEAKDLELALDVLTMEQDKLKAFSSLNQTSHAVFISGYVPEKYSETLVKEIEENFEAYVELITPSEKEEVPVALENNKFSAPVTGVLNAFGLPGKGEIDPVGIMSIFYYVLFGLMFSDAGYGLLMVLVCGFIMLKYKKSDAPIMGSVRMFFWCGLSTAIWGVVLGSFFGDALEVISQNFLGKNWVTPTLWFAPLKEPMKMLIFTMAIGIVHMYTGLFLSGYQLIKAGKVKDCIFDVVSWLFLVTSLIFLLMGSAIFEGIAGFKLNYLPWHNYLIYAFALIGAVIIILTAGRESKSPFKRILKGLYGLYNVTGWLGDVISYSRLLALGLATGVVGSVVNQMGAMLGSPVAFILVFIIGHGLNFAINVLGAYVHCNRLQFVEFFGKFFEGGGKEFAPLKINTSKYTLKEDK